MSLIAKKQNLVQDIQNNFQVAKAVIFYDFHYVENEKIFQLKKELKRNGCLWKVYKNTLVQKVLREKISSLTLTKVNAWIFCQQDEYQPLKVLAQFNKENDPNFPRFHGGIYEGNLISIEKLEKWAQLPNRQVLLQNLCYYLTFHLRRLLNLLEQLKNKKVQN